MARKYRDPEAPEVLEEVLARMRAMTREEWIRELNWRPEGVPETRRTAQVAEEEPAESASDPQAPGAAVPAPGTPSKAR